MRLIISLLKSSDKPDRPHLISSIDLSNDRDITHVFIRRPYIPYIP